MCPNFSVEPHVTSSPEPGYCGAAIPCRHRQINWEAATELFGSAADDKKARPPTWTQICCTAGNACRWTAFCFMFRTGLLRRSSRYASTMARRTAPSEPLVVIMGSTGTGKSDVSVPQPLQFTV